MYIVEFINNEISKKEQISFTRFQPAFIQYIEILSMPWWDADISDLKILKNGKDITEKLNKILEEMGK